MSQQVAVIGAAGVQARAMLRALAKALDPRSVIAVDRHWSDQARAELADAGYEALEMDAIDQRPQLAGRIGGVKLIANLAGPGYAVGTGPLDLAVEIGADYVDICDDADATLALLDRQDAVREAGVKALIGMGTSPGTTNLLSKIAIDALAGVGEPSVRIAWTVDILDQTPATIRHYLHCLATTRPPDIHTPRWRELNPEMVDFDEPIGRQEVVDLGHPEPVTLPRFTDAVLVENKGGVTPGEFLNLFWLLSRLNDKGVPNDELLAIYEHYRPSGLIGHQRRGTSMHLDVHVKGDGYRFVSVSRMSMEHATGLPAAAGILLMLDDALDRPGVFPAECVSPRRFFEKLRLVSEGGGGMHLVRLENGQPGERLRIRDLMAAQSYA